MKSLILILAFLFIANIPPIKNIFTFFIDENHYRYSNYDGSFTFIEFKGHDTEMMGRKENAFNKKHFLDSNTVVFRCFRKNPLALWRWAEYFYDKRYKLPYKNWKEIRKRRGSDLEYSNNWQDF